VATDVVPADALEFVNGGVEGDGADDVGSTAPLRGDALAAAALQLAGC
jgi:hypothetical protein